MDHCLKLQATSLSLYKADNFVSSVGHDQLKKDPDLSEINQSNPDTAGRRGPDTQLYNQLK